MVEALLCDIDGTLVQSNWLHAEAWQVALGAAGIHLELEELRRQQHRLAANWRAHRGTRNFLRGEHREGQATVARRAEAETRGATADGASGLVG